MKNAKQLLPALAVLLCVSLSCSFLKGRSASSPYGVKEADILPLAKIDENAPFPALSTDAINALILESPEVAKHRDKILDMERAAINGLVADSRAKSEALNAYTNDLNFAPVPFETTSQSGDGFIGSISFIPVAYAAENPPPMPDMGGIEYFAIGHQAGFFTPDFEKARDRDRGKSETKEVKDETTGTVIASRTTSVGSDGTVSLELTTSINLPEFGLNANSRVKVTGNQCPSADGKIELTIELGTNGRAGSAGSVIYDKTLSGKVVATVNDDAELTGFDFDLNQSTRSTAGGRQVYIETSDIVRSANGTYSGMDFDDPKLVRASSQATAEDQTLSSKGLVNAFLLAQGILENAKERWKDGGCVKIEAKPPGSVDVNSTHQIPVKVTSKVDGADVPSKLESKLTGGASIDPTLIPKTAGTLTYTAPGERNKKATISLKATSRRGIAKLDLDASTGSNSYRVSGTSNGVSFKGDICNVANGFILDATFPGGTATVNFIKDGTTDTDGEGNKCTMKGKGTYKLSIGDDDTGTLNWTTTDKLTCPGFGNSRTSSFTVTLQPAPDLSCN